MADLPDQGRVQAMALAYIRTWLDEDYPAQDQIRKALKASGASMEQVAEVFALMAAKLLAQAHDGNTAAAADHATAVTDDQVAAHIRLLLAA